MRLRVVWIGILFFWTLTFFSKPLFAYDDPAVVICEEIAKLDIPPSGKYRRIDSKIEKLVVTILYEVTILTTKPRESSKTCTFAYDKKNNIFAFDPNYSNEEQFRICQAKIAEGEEVRERLIREKDSKGLEARRAEMESCQSYFKSRMIKILDELKVIASTGLRGIKPEDTSLKIP